MAVRTETHQIKGMQRDFSMSKANKDFVFDALNIRMTAREDNTLLSITNEKGNSPITLQEKTEKGLEDTSIKGVVLGYCVINKTLVLFSTYSSNNTTTDYIYKVIKEGNDYILINLYEGILGFKNDYPIESIGIFENEAIQKVYWVDGENPVRFINVATDNKYKGDSSIFNFVRNLKLEEEITITSNETAKGMFPSGTVQYAFTYYNKFGSESNIVYQSPLYYSHIGDRGGSPEEIASNSFDIELKSLDNSFEYIRIYSILRTTKDDVAVVKRVADLKVPANRGPIIYTDTNTTGELVDTTFLLYVGGENIIPECMTHKDNTLFLGNYKLNKESLSLNEDVNNAIVNNKDINFYTEETPFSIDASSWYNYLTQLKYNSYQITTLKANETYRFGIQFQDKEGKWSEVLHIADTSSDKHPTVSAPSNEVYKLRKVEASYTIPDDIVNIAYDKGYIKARGVIVYPTNNDREILCQGILNPTVSKHINALGKGVPFVQSSWFFRPDTSLSSSLISWEKGTLAPYKNSSDVNNYSNPRSIEIGIEIHPSSNNAYNINANYVTMHSPDIEFSNVLDSNQNGDIKMRIVGYIPITGNVSYREVTASTVAANTDDYGMYSYFPSTFTTISSEKYEGGGEILSSGIHWIGSAIKKSGDNSWVSLEKNVGWLVSPWQRSGSLINDFAKRKDGSVISKLKNNRLLNYRTSNDFHYFYPKEGTDLQKAISFYDKNIDLAIFDSNEKTIVYPGNLDASYQGNIDDVILPDDSENVIYFVPKEGLPSDIYKADDSSITFLGSSTTGNYSIASLGKDYVYNNNPVSIKYKSTKHAVLYLGLDSNTKKAIVLPYAVKAPKLSIEGGIDIGTGIKIERECSILWLAELYKEVSNKFGGNTQEAILNNRWHVAGEAIPLVKNGGNQVNIVRYSQGDTYFQRYDCLKTYPYSLEDENNVTEILSFFCETQINLDGRYDRNRRNTKNLALSPSNFNLLNTAYSQSNNYFNYFTLDPNLNVTNFNSSIAWSKEKHSGEDVDAWTNINLASNLDLDGSKGDITALKTFNNEIFCFQKEGISNILFNSRVQIPTSDGVPIEITNGLKVEGKRYLSSVGCNNKWSIAESPNGLYFIDNITDGIYLFNGKLTSLSDSLGFRQWVKENNSLAKWNPEEFKNFKTHYDKNNRDVYFTNDKYCLCYSELLNQFTSFMSYEKTPYMFNIENALFSIKKNKDNEYTIWEQFKGEYNKFYEEPKPYSLTFISNSDPFYDKIFNNLEFRSDTYELITKDKEGKDIEPYWELSDKTFDTIQVENEYQNTGEVDLSHKKDSISNLKRKFRVWRIQIPRDKNGRDRIRNTWAKVKLTHKNPSNCKTEFHDLMVHYFV